MYARVTELGRLLEKEGLLGALPRESYADLCRVLWYAGSHRKMAQKRALVAAVLSSCGASEFFSQDLEGMGGKGRCSKMRDFG